MVYENNYKKKTVSVPLLRIDNLNKTFGGVQALSNVNLEIYPGEVHGLIGSNGAGKSTLIKILSGDINADSGQIYLEGHPLEIHNTQEAYKLGFSFIHQELNLVPKFSILKNLTLGMKKPTKFGFIDWKAVKHSVKNVVEKVALNKPLDTLVEDLSVADQWLVTIAHALMRNIKLISMDEPTASLSAEESERLFKVIADLTVDGISVLYVSHRLDEVLNLCDVISVFKDGKCVLTTNRQKATKNDLVSAIVGTEINEARQLNSKYIENNEEVLRLQNISKGKKVKNISFALHKGEVLGIGGLVGSGRTELAELIFGVERPDSGSMYLEGKKYEPKNINSAINSGIGLVPEERRSQGLILKDTVDFNVNLTNLSRLRFKKNIFLLDKRKFAEISKNIINLLRIKTPSIYTSVINLSGGNQQKIVIGKWLSRQLKVLILDEPSRGVDVGARAEIHEQIRYLAKKGTSIIVISSDNEELPHICDSVLIMSDGNLVAELKGMDITKETILYKSYEHIS